MSYSPKALAPLKIDILSVDNPSTFTVGSKTPISGTPVNTSVTISNGQLVLNSGKNYRIEASFYSWWTTASDNYGTAEYQIYDITNSNYIGNSAYTTGANASTTTESGLYDGSKFGRCVASVLLTSSEMSSNRTIELRLKSVTGPLQSFFSNYGQPTIRVIEFDPQ